MKNLKFKIFLTLVATLSGLLFSGAIILQVYNYKNQQNNDIIDHYNDLSKEFLDYIVEMFINHPEMNYYFDDLNGNKLIDKDTKRNYILETQISILIFSKMAKFAIFTQQNDNPENSIKIKNWMGHVMDTFIKSPTLKYYWSDVYKPKFSGPASRAYMFENYNL
jgi:hypothetical protein